MTKINFLELLIVVLHLTVICQIDTTSFQSIEPFLGGQYFFSIFWVYFLEMLPFLCGFSNVFMVLDEYCFLKK